MTRQWSCPQVLSERCFQFYLESTSYVVISGNSSTDIRIRDNDGIYTAAHPLSLFVHVYTGADLGNCKGGFSGIIDCAHSVRKIFIATPTCGDHAPCR